MRGQLLLRYQFFNRWVAMRGHISLSIKKSETIIITVVQKHADGFCLHPYRTESFVLSQSCSPTTSGHLLLDWKLPARGGKKRSLVGADSSPEVSLRQTLRLHTWATPPLQSAPSALLPAHTVWHLNPVKGIISPRGQHSRTKTSIFTVFCTKWRKWSCVGINTTFWPFSHLTSWVSESAELIF